jgi:transcriptional regulator with XRE-family HTH domain
MTRIRGYQGGVEFDPGPLRRAMKLQGFTQGDLALAAHCSISTVSLTLRGRSRNAGTIRRFYEILNVSPADCWPEAEEGMA